MQKLKSVIKKAITNDPFELIYSGYAKKDDYSQAIYNFQLLELEKKHEILQKMSYNLSKKNYSNRQVLSILTLIDFCAVLYPEEFTQLPSKLIEQYRKKGKVIPVTKTEKVLISENNLILFYLKYLQIKVWENIDHEQIEEFPEATIYAQKSIQSIKLFLDSDFLFQFSLVNSNHLELVKIVTQNVLKRISEDMKYLKKYLQKWVEAIFEDEGNRSIRINQIYEQTLYIGKRTQKLEYLNREIGKSIKFDKYILDKELNQGIQKVMFGKQKQKIALISERLIKTEASHVQIQMQSEKIEEITESEIICNVKL